MMFDFTTIALIATAAALLVLLSLLVFKRKTAEPQSLLRKVSQAYLSQFLIPDGQGGEIHIENALLCPRGIVIIDFKDIEGNIFGSDAMQDWTVITGSKRFTFANPQHGLFDRTAAVSYLVPDVPVTGYIAFTGRGKFTKGQPGYVIGLDALIKELTAEARDSGEAIKAYWPSWEILRDAAVVAQVGHLIED